MTKLTRCLMQLKSCFHTICLVLIHQVYVNGKEYYLFKHRIPLENVAALNIKGDIVVNIGGFIQVSQ